MAKRIEVVYKNLCKDGEIVTEDCYLLEDSDEIYANHPESGVWMLGKVGESDIMMGVIAAGLVMFEDEEGVFGLYPEVIISIKER